MALTRELAILLVQLRQVLIYLSLVLVFALVVDTLTKFHRLKRKIVISVIVSIFTVIQIAIEIAAGIIMYESIIVLLCMVIYTILQAVCRHQRRKHHG